MILPSRARLQRRAEYLEKLEAEVKWIDAYEKPFDAEILSDEHFGIPAAE